VWYERWAVLFSNGRFILYLSKEDCRKEAKPDLVVHCPFGCGVEVTS